MVCPPNVIRARERWRRPPTGTTPSHGDVAAGGQPRSSEAIPAPGGEHSATVPDPAASPAARPTAGVDPAPATHASLGSGIREGTLDLSSPTPPISVGPVADAGSPAALDLVGRSGAVGVPAGTPDMPRAAAPDPSSTPPVVSERGPSVGPPNPIPDARAGVAESSSAAGESAAQPAGAPAARSADTTAAHAGPGTQHGDVERIAAGTRRRQHSGASDRADRPRASRAPGRPVDSARTLT